MRISRVGRCEKKSRPCARLGSKIAGGTPSPGSPPTGGPSPSVPGDRGLPFDWVRLREGSLRGWCSKRKPEYVRKQRGSESVTTIKDWDALHTPPGAPGQLRLEGAGARLLAIPDGLEGVKRMNGLTHKREATENRPPARAP